MLVISTVLQAPALLPLQRLWADCLRVFYHRQAAGAPFGETFECLADQNICCNMVKFASTICLTPTMIKARLVLGTFFSDDGDAEPLLGVTVLRSVGIEVDPRNQTLKRLPRTRLWSAEVYVRVLRTRIHRVLTLAMRRRRERICIRHLIF